MRSIVLLAAVFALSLSACSKKAEPTSTAAGGAELGVPECDSYVNKYMTCIENKAPKEVRDTMKQSFEAQKAAWKQAASTDEGKKALAGACKQADDAAKAAMAAYGCEW